MRLSTLSNLATILLINVGLQSVLFSTSVHAFQNSDLTTIDIVRAHKDRRDIAISEFASSIEYVKLETSENTLFRYPKVKGTLGDSLILVKSADLISLFDRKSGKFLRHIGHPGEDPEGYSNTLPQLGFNSKNKSIFARRNIFDLCEYDVSTGKMLNTIPGPTIPERDKHSVKTNKFTVISSFASFGWMEDKYIVGYFSNLGGEEPLKLVIYDKAGQLIKCHGNKQSFEKKDFFTIKPQNADFYNYRNRLYFKEWYNDTVFHVGVNELTPHILFQTGKYSPPYKKQDMLTAEDKKKFIFIDGVIETADFTFFNSRFNDRYSIGIHNKQTGASSISKTKRDQTGSGFKNDIDDFVPFVPTFINAEGELVGEVSAEVILQWFEENPKKISLLPDHLKMLQTLEPEDNPIIMIAQPILTR